MQAYFTAMLADMYAWRKFIAFLGWLWIILAAIWFSLLFSSHPALQDYMWTIVGEMVFCAGWGGLKLWLVKYLEKRFAGT